MLFRSRALGAPFRAFAEYNPLSMVGKAIFDGEPSKPTAPAAARTRTPAQAERKADYKRRAASERAAGREGNAKFYEREAARLKKGGKIDGCAKRGLTKAKRK